MKKMSLSRPVLVAVLSFSLVSAPAQAKLVDVVIAIPAILGGMFTAIEGGMAFKNSFGENPTFAGDYLSLAGLNYFSSPNFKRAVAACVFTAGSYAAYKGVKQIVVGDGDNYDDDEE